jgi:hypothetical protein
VTSRFAITATTRTIHTHALLMDFTALCGSRAASSSEPVRGTAGAGEAGVVTDTAGTADAATVMADAGR